MDVGRMLVTTNLEMLNGQGLAEPPAGRGTVGAPRKDVHEYFLPPPIAKRAPGSRSPHAYTPQAPGEKGEKEWKTPGGNHLSGDDRTLRTTLGTPSCARGGRKRQNARKPLSTLHNILPGLLCFWGQSALIDAVTDTLCHWVGQ